MMQPRTPITVITGPLGSGKTTLLRHVLASAKRKLAIVMNEFGEIAIDSKILEGANVRIAELAGGCVCCSLVGEFEAAVNEIIDTVAPEHLVLETTGVAEPGALVFDIQENLPRVRLDGVVCVVDADGLLKFPSLGHSTRVQIETADLILLNKTDLVSPADLQAEAKTLHEINPAARIVHTLRCQVDTDLLFGIARRREMPQPHHVHQPEFDSFSYFSGATFSRPAFEAFAGGLAHEVYRAKGFVRFCDGTHLFNFVNGRWELEPFEGARTELVFIGERLGKRQEGILARLKACERPAAGYEFVEGLTVADIAFRAWGAGLSEVFSAAGDATLNAMIDNLDEVAPKQKHTVHLANDALDLLLFDFLQELIYFKDSQQLLLRARDIRISEKDGKHALEAELHGEKLDPARHSQRVDVKAVTLHQFKLEKTEQGWEVTVILDV
jgi:G3E family GTPase/SHS2 domain-containing protein